MSPIKLLLLCLGLATAFNNLAAPRPAVKPRAHVVAAVASWYDKGQRLDGTFFDAKAVPMDEERWGEPPAPSSAVSDETNPAMIGAAVLALAAAAGVYFTQQSPM